MSKRRWVPMRYRPAGVTKNKSEKFLIWWFTPEGTMLSCTLPMCETHEEAWKKLEDYCIERNRPVAQPE